MLRKNESRYAILCALSAVLLASCSSSQKSVSYSTDEYGRTVKTTQEIQPNPSYLPTTNPTSLPPAKINDNTTTVTVDTAPNKPAHRPIAQAYTDNYGTHHVRAQLVKVDSNEYTGRTRVKVPFVTVSGSEGNRHTRVRLPGITIFEN